MGVAYDVLLQLLAGRCADMPVKKDEKMSKSLCFVFCVILLVVRGTTGCNEGWSIG